MRRLTKDAAKQLAHPEPVDVEIPEWDCIVSVRHLTAPERIDYISGLTEDVAGGINGLVELVHLTAVDESGEPLWTRDEAGAIEQRVLARIGNASASINGLSVEEEQGNS